MLILDSKTLIRVLRLTDQSAEKADSDLMMLYEWIDTFLLSKVLNLDKR